MNKVLMAISAVCAWSCAQAVDYNEYFFDKGLRLDYYHAGDALTEEFYFDELVEQPYYAGSRVNLVDTCGYGCYQLRLVDKATGQLIYQHNYDNLMKEWRTIPEAKTMRRAMPESVMMPYPRKPAQAQIWTRGADQRFSQQFAYDIDPDDYFIRRFTPTLQAIDISYMGKPENCVDVVLIPEGYTEAEKADFVKDCEFFAESLFSYAPYGDNQDRFNIRAVWAPSLQSGVTVPSEHKWVETACGANYDTFYSERYQMVTDMQRLADIAAHVPYDYIYIISNSQKYGGGAIYNWYGISAAHIKSRPESTRKTYAHEFGHLLLGLGDEYVGGSDTDLYRLDVEPWEPNLTTLVDFGKKWRFMVDKGAKLPSDLPKGYDREQQYKMSDFKVGAYEGGGYLEKGIYRPVPNCMMNWMHTQDEFCPVCSYYIRAYIDYITK